MLSVDLVVLVVVVPVVFWFELPVGCSIALSFMSFRSGVWWLC